MPVDINYDITNPRKVDQILEKAVEDLQSVKFNKSCTTALLCGDSHSDQFAFDLATNTILDANPHALAAAQALVAPTWKKFATGGFTPNQWISTYLTSALQAIVYGKTVAFFTLGTNGALVTTDLANSKQVLQTIYSEFQKAGCYVVFNTIPPKTGGEALGALEFNLWMVNYFNGLPGVEVVNDFQYLIDGAIPSTWKAGYSQDNTHRSNQGALISSYQLVDVYKRLFIPASVIYTNQEVYTQQNTGSQKFTNVLANPLLVGATNGLTTGWAKIDTGVTTVTTKEAAPNGIGEAQILTITSPSSAGAKEVIVGTTDVLATVAVGNICSGSVIVEVTSATNMTMFEVALAKSGTKFTKWNTNYLPGGFVLNSYVFTSPKTFYAKTLPAPMPAGGSDLRMLITVQFKQNVAGSAVIKLYQAEIENLNING